MMRARGRHSGADADNPFWITYSDLLSSLVMVFLVLLLAFMGLSTIENKKLREQTHVLEIQKEQLEGQQKTLDQMQKQLTKLEINDKLEHLGELRLVHRLVERDLGGELRAVLGGELVEPVHPDFAARR